MSPRSAQTVLDRAESGARRGRVRSRPTTRKRRLGSVGSSGSMSAQVTTGDGTCGGDRRDDGAGTAEVGVGASDRRLRFAGVARSSVIPDGRE